MSNVVVTGLGVVSSIGNSCREVLPALRQGRSGIVYLPEMQALGFKCCLYGTIKGLDTSCIGKRQLRTMSDVSRYAAVAALEALENARLKKEDVAGERTGIVLGSGLGGISEVTRIEWMLQDGMALSRAGASGPVRMMGSTAAANLAACLGVKGRVYSLTSACCTGLDSIGHGYEMLRHGILDVCFCGGAEETMWKHIGAAFDNSGEMPRSYNERPEHACRPFDRDREGFVLSAGAGVLVLERREHAEGRRAPILGEIVGYGSADDGVDMFRPTGEGLERAVRQCLDCAREHDVTHIDYINPHGTGTQIGDMLEAKLIRKLFGEGPRVSSTKAVSGHALSATGAQEAVYTMLMLSNGFIGPTVNLDNIAAECNGIRHVTELYEGPLQTAMTFNSGLGGTNACVLFRKE